MHKLNPRTAALLSAFGWAVGYLLCGLAALVGRTPKKQDSGKDVTER